MVTIVDNSPWMSTQAFLFPLHRVISTFVDLNLHLYHRKHQLGGVLQFGILRTLTRRFALLLFRLKEDRLWAVHDFEIRRHGEQRRTGLRAHDVRKAERLLSHARIAPPAVNDGLEIGRSPHLCNNRDGPIISDLSRGDRVGRPHAVHKDAFHSLRTKVLRTPLILFTGNQMLFEEYPRRRSSDSHRLGIGWR